MAGNSLIGLLKVDNKRFSDGDAPAQQDMMQRVNAQQFRHALAEKNRLIALYRDTDSAYSDHLQSLRQEINEQRNEAHSALNDILLDDFRALKIQYEQAQLKGKAVKRSLAIDDIEALTPFHWGYEFDEIIEARGGFDVIITNPPWETFKPYEKEFFVQFDERVTTNKMRITDFKRLKTELLTNGEIRENYLKYLSDYRHVSAFYRSTPQYKNQISRVNGRKQGSDINLYKLFTEQCFNLLRDGGTCGIVIPSGIYSDLGTKQLRKMLFEKTQVSGLFGFENRKAIFEGVHSRFKFVVLTFEKCGRTEQFPAAFMRHDVAELEHFRHDDGVMIDIDLVKRSSPTSLSVTEFKNSLDVRIVEKLLKFPLLGEELPDTWNVKLFREFDMSNDSDLFRDEPGASRLPLYQGRMIWQFQHGYAPPRYWIDEAEGRERALGRTGLDVGQILGYQTFRFAIRRIARGSDKRTMIATVLPRNVFASDSFNISESLVSRHLLTCISQVNSFVADWVIRQKVVTTLNMFYLYQLPIPRLQPGDRFSDSVVRRAAQLICTAPEFDDLAAAVGLGGHHNGVTDPAGRAKLRAELDGIIAHIYGLTEDEFAYVLSTFPLVAEPVKAAALAAYRDVERGVK